MSKLLLVLAALLLFLSHPKENLASATAIRTAPVVSYRLTIPSINLETPVIPTGLNSQKIQEVPETIAGLYEFGAKPGERGTAVLVGHTPGVFSNLTRLKNGDRIFLNGHTYQINNIIIYKTAAFPTKEIYGPGNGFGLNIITCHGAGERLVIFSNMILTRG